MAEAAGTDLSRRPPTPEEMAGARQAAGALARCATAAGALPLRVGRDDEPDAVVELPPAVARLLIDLLAHVGRGEAVAFVPTAAELTTQQAADLLNVSRPFLVKLIEGGEIPHHKVGAHRRIRAADLIAYRQRRDAMREEALTELARLGQEIEAE